MKKIIFYYSFIFLLFSCGMDQFHKETINQFGDQHFKTSISLIELHKLRYGIYPQSLDSLTYIGDWDKMALSFVEYKRLVNGYELNIKNIMSGKELLLKYPTDFWKGLGLKKTNVQKLN